MKDRNHRNESGQSILVIAFIVMVLLALVALVVDVGNAYAQRRIVQNAVDAAAMAGALKISEHNPDFDHPELTNLVSELAVWRAINDYATANGLASGEEGSPDDGWDAWFIDSSGAHGPDTVDQFNSPIPDWADGVRVEGTLPFDTYFAHLIGFDQMEVDAEAPAYMLSGPCSADHLFPMAVNIANFADEPDGLPVIGHPYILFEKELAASAAKVPGWWWVHWEGRGTGSSPSQGPSDTVLDCNMIDTSRSGEWHVGNWVQRADGVKSWPKAEDVMRPRIENTGTSMETCDDSSKFVTLVPTVTIPIFDVFADKGCLDPWDPEVCDIPRANDVYRIVGFAEFRLSCFKKGDKESETIGDCSGCGTEKEQGNCIKGEFVRWVDDSMEDGCIPTGITAPSFRLPSPTVTPLP